jgi:hypothetical protein
MFAITSARRQQGSKCREEAQYPDSFAKQLYIFPGSRNCILARYEIIPSIAKAYSYDITLLSHPLNILQ